MLPQTEAVNSIFRRLLLKMKSETEAGVVSKLGLGGVIACPVPYREWGAPGRSVDLHFNAAEAGIGKPLRGIVSQQVLGAQLVADFLEGVVELRHRRGIEVF